MSATPTTPVEPPSRDVLLLELANQKAQFVVLEREWQAQDRALAAKARELRQCGERVSALERSLGTTDDYTNGQSHVKVGT